MPDPIANPPAGDTPPPGNTPPAGDTPPPGNTPPAGDTPPPGGDIPPASYWPEDWREKYANGDEKLLKGLQKFDSPKAVIDAYNSLQRKVSSGGMKSTKPKDATPEVLAAWRAENGIPEKPADYDTSLPDGLVIGESDKPLIEGFLNAAHETDMSPEQVKKALSWYYTEQERQIEELQQNDLSLKKENEDALRVEWGKDYRRNINMISNMLDAAPAGVKDKLLGGRLSDGTPIGSSPEVLRWLVGVSLELNPAATVVPGAGPNAAGAIDAEITTIEKRMAEDRKGYFKDQAMQDRYRQLLEARERGQRKAA